MQQQQDIKKLNRLAWDHGDLLVSAGKGLEAIGNLMGGDASEHMVNESDMEGLAHAVKAISGYVTSAGFELSCEAVEPGIFETEKLL